MKYLHQLKSLAKKISKKDNLILTKAQDQVAVENGYQDWQKLTQDFTFCIGFWKPDGAFEVLKTSQKTIDKHNEGGCNPHLLRGFQDLVAGENNGKTHGLIEAIPNSYMNQLFPGFTDAKIMVLTDEQGLPKKLKPHAIKPLVGSIAFIGQKPIYHEGEFEGNEWIGLNDSQIKLCEAFKPSEKISWPISLKELWQLGDKMEYHNFRDYLSALNLTKRQVYSYLRIESYFKEDVFSGLKNWLQDDLAKAIHIVSMNVINESNFETIIPKIMASKNQDDLREILQKERDIIQKQHEAKEGLGSQKPDYIEFKSGSFEKLKEEIKENIDDSNHLRILNNAKTVHDLAYLCEHNGRSLGEFIELIGTYKIISQDPSWAHHSWENT